MRVRMASSTVSFSTVRMKLVISGHISSRSTSREPLREPYPLLDSCVQEGHLCHVIAWQLFAPR